MIKIQSSTLGRTLETQRLVADIKGEKKGPLLIITGGMHGNEPSGVMAAHDFVKSLGSSNDLQRGRIVAFAGNLKALSKNKRYIDVDLNRIWNGYSGGGHEVKEKEELWNEITRVTGETDHSKLVHVDLHSTSSPTTPFMAMSKTEPNQRLSRLVPVPAIPELDKVVKTPLLSKIAAMGHASIAFEGGIIGDNLTYRNHVALLWVVAAALNMLPGGFTTEPKFQRSFLERQSPYSGKSFKITYVHRVQPEDGFVMNPGHSNFDLVQQGDVLGKDNNGNVRAPERGLLFMPLYQASGSEGFYILRSPGG